MQDVDDEQGNIPNQSEECTKLEFLKSNFYPPNNKDGESPNNEETEFDARDHTFKSSMTQQTDHVLNSTREQMLNSARSIDG